MPLKFLFYPSSKWNNVLLKILQHVRLVCQWNSILLQFITSVFALLNVFHHFVRMILLYLVWSYLVPFLHRHSSPCMTRHWDEECQATALDPIFVAGLILRIWIPMAARGAVYICIYYIYITFMCVHIHSCWIHSDHLAKLMLCALWIEKQTIQKAQLDKQWPTQQKNKKTYLHLPKGAVRTLRDVV